MKGHKLPTVISLLIVLAAGWLTWNAVFPRTSVPEVTARLVYRYEDKDIDVQLTAGESESLRSILDGHRLYPVAMTGEPSCGFTKDVSIRFDGQVFCVANDSCAVIAFEGKSFDIREADRKTIDQVFQKCGGSFPCL